MTPKRKQKREQWEYNTHVGWNGIASPNNLDVYGSREWELVSVTLSQNGQTIAYFKRPRRNK